MFFIRTEGHGKMFKLNFMAFAWIFIEIYDNKKIAAGIEFCSKTLKNDYFSMIF